MGLAVRVPGPLDVTCGGRLVAIKGTKERTLLGHLALERGRAVSADRLVEALWSGNPPESAVASLRVLVSRLRKALADAGAPDVSLPGNWAVFAAVG